MFDWLVAGVFGVFLLLALSGVGFPLPEEVALLLAGIYASISGLWWPVVLCGIFGIAAADTIAYARGRFHAAQFSKFRKGAKFITQNGVLAVILSRVFIATRVIVPYMAGAMRMPRTKFHLASIVGACISAFVVIAIGRWVYGALLVALPVAAPFIALATLSILTAYLVREGAKAHLQLLEGAKQDEAQ